jgi:hypothetical protein
MCGDCRKRLIDPLVTGSGLFSVGTAASLAILRKAQPRSRCEVADRGNHFRSLMGRSKTGDRNAKAPCWQAGCGDRLQRVHGPRGAALFVAEGAEVFADARDLTRPNAAGDLIQKAGHVDVRIANLAFSYYRGCALALSDSEMERTFRRLVYPLHRLTRVSYRKCSRVSMIRSLWSAAPRPYGGEREFRFTLPLGKRSTPVFAMSPWRPRPTSKSTQSAGPLLRTPLSFNDPISKPTSSNSASHKFPPGGSQLAGNQRGLYFSWPAPRPTFSSARSYRFQGDRFESSQALYSEKRPDRADGQNTRLGQGTIDHQAQSFRI